MDISLIKFKDNTYCWSKKPNTDTNLNRAEVIALGYWKYKIPKSEIKLALSVLENNKYDVALFSDFFKLFIMAKKIDYNGMK